MNTKTISRLKEIVGNKQRIEYYDYRFIAGAWIEPSEDDKFLLSVAPKIPTTPQFSNGGAGNSAENEYGTWIREESKFASTGHLVNYIFIPNALVTGA